MDFIKSDDAEYWAPAKALPFRVFSVFRGYPVMDSSTALPSPSSWWTSLRAALENLFFGLKRALLHFSGLLLELSTRLLRFLARLLVFSSRLLDVARLLLQIWAVFTVFATALLVF